MVGQHDNRYVRPDVLDLVGDGCAIQQAEVVFEDNRIHRLRHEKTQAIATVGRGGQLVSVFPQQLKLGWIPVYAQQHIGRHPVTYTGRCRTNLFNIAQIVLRNSSHGVSHPCRFPNLVNFDQFPSPFSLNTGSNNHKQCYRGSSTHPAVRRDSSTNQPLST